MISIRYIIVSEIENMCFVAIIPEYLYFVSLGKRVEAS
jgi:hypothetical protein